DLTRFPGESQVVGDSDQPVGPHILARFHRTADFFATFSAVFAFFVLIPVSLGKKERLRNRKSAKVSQRTQRNKEDRTPLFPRLQVRIILDSIWNQSGNRR